MKETLSFHEIKESITNMHENQIFNGSAKIGKIKRNSY